MMTIFVYYWIGTQAIGNIDRLLIVTFPFGFNKPLFLSKTGGH